MKNRIKYRNKCVLYVQKVVRGFLARKRHQPRYRGIMNIKLLKANLAKTAEIANQLRGSKDVILRQVAEIEQLIHSSVQKIKVKLLLLLFMKNEMSEFKLSRIHFRWTRELIQK